MYTIKPSNILGEILNLTKSEKETMVLAQTHIPEAVHLKKVVEECLELSLAVLWNADGKVDTYDCVSELVDVEIVVEKYKQLLKGTMGEKDFEHFYKSLRKEKFEKLRRAAELEKRKAERNGN